MARLFYTAFAVVPSRLPTYAGDANQQVKAFTAATGGTEITDLTSDKAGTQALAPLLTDSTGSLSVWIEAGTAAQDDVVWFQVVGSTAPRFGVGPASGGFVTRDTGDAAYAPRTGAPGDASKFYRGDGTWAPAAGGTGSLNSRTDATTLAVTLTSGPGNTDVPMPATGQSIFGRRTPATGSRARLDNASSGQAMPRWIGDPSRSPMAAVLDGDSTGGSPNVVTYRRFFEILAQLLADRLAPSTSYLGVGVRLNITDLPNMPNQGGLQLAVVAGATTIRSSLNLPAGTKLRLDGYGELGETVTVTGAPTAAGGGFFDTPVTACAFAHAVNAAVGGPGAPGDFTRSAWQPPTMLRTHPDGLPRVVLPGTTSNGNLQLPGTIENSLSGAALPTIAIQFTPASWSTTQNVVCRSLSTPSYGPQLRINSDGTISYRYSIDGTQLVTVTSTTSFSNLPVGAWACAEHDPTAGTVTWLTSTDGVTWTQVEVVNTTANVTVWDPPGVPWSIGALSSGGGGNYFAGEVYGIRISRFGRFGPSIVPVYPHAWDINNVVHDWIGGPLLDLYNASWFGRGATDFADPRWSALLMPRVTALLALLNLGHNDGRASAASTLRSQYRSVADRMNHLMPVAEKVLLEQNPTLRDDGALAVAASPRWQEKHRVAVATAWAINEMKWRVCDMTSVFTDYVDGCRTSKRQPIATRPDGTPGDGTLADLIDTTQAGKVHPWGEGARLMAEKANDELFGA